MSPLKEHVHDSNQNQNQNQTSNTSQLKFRATCDSCAASKVRCTKEPHGCSRCVQNGLICVYGRSRRKGKPPSNKNGFAQAPRHSQLSPVPMSLDAPPSPPGVPAPPSWADQQPGHHQPNYNFNCSWTRSPMFSAPSYQSQAVNNVIINNCNLSPSPMFPSTIQNQTPDNVIITERERRTSNSLTRHQLIPDDSTASQMPINSGSISRPNLSGTDPTVTDTADFGFHPRKAVPEDHHLDKELEEPEDANEDQHEPCITMASRVLSSLYQFVRSDCGNGHSNNGFRDQRKSPTEKDPTSDILFRVTQSATETVSRLLNCTGSACAQDASMLLVLGAILHKVLTWYQALYQSEIGVLSSYAPSAQQDANPTRPPLESHPSNSWSGDQVMLSRQVDGTGDSVYTVPLTIPLSVGTLNISRTTETKMKAQLLLCQLQNLHQVCQGLDRRVQGAENMRREKNLCAGSNAQLLEKVDELQRVLAAVCTQTPM